ncbi:MAG: thiol:disulfide interchange protein DsbA/DsbL [Burkholderiaceae bacterium]|jgi:thiol:disulfide interchange protein DsbA|nr:thiol:disulfide interchange protein DsbA/DsbL [Burkholderiaceae bacterium]MCO5103336.1 thiol:disulfide interchange protein DsbA/DsbL [Burkholderiaceae bacterium]MCO5109223.1 thiol:disulfide interchange protein DsbA/DsbL [Burkholderiaceae bacterium]
MNRRDFSTATAATAGAMLVSGFSLPVWAQSAAPKEGKEYTRLSKPVATDAPAGKVEVIEFFWYNCPHCNEFEPTLEAWLKTAPKNIAFRRVPIAFNASFAPQQKLYYALEGMGKVDELHSRLFRAIHVEKQNLSKDDAIFAWIGKQPGMDLAKFKEMYNSFTVSNQVRKASQLQDAYGVEGVPSMGVAGRYYVDGTMAGSLKAMLKVVEALAAKSP